MGDELDELAKRLEAAEAAVQVGTQARMRHRPTVPTRRLAYCCQAQALSTPLHPRPALCVTAHRQLPVSNTDHALKLTRGALPRLRSLQAAGPEQLDEMRGRVDALNGKMDQHSNQVGVC